MKLYIKLNLTSLLIVTFVTGFILILCVIGIYIYKFGHISISSKKDDWDLFSTYINGILSPIISFIALVVTTYIAYEFNNYQRRQQQIKDEEQLQQTTIELFKEWRDPGVLAARKQAWNVKRKWESNPAFRPIFIKAMIMEESVNIKELDLSVLEDEFRAVYDLFAFYNMLSLYSSNEKNIRNLNYFSYPWWRHFLYEVAKEYDKEKLQYVFDTKGNNTQLYERFRKNISFTSYLKRLDEICGFLEIDEPDKGNLFEFFKKPFA